ncbi:chorismate-binding protein [Rivibacter subsaxonicus]|uniref:Para-aminobenzoate synthetase/4-amino-4-deoxychorismate lyase n=1 Tax=Rivibacter subsaxonicus TaxID=457575 RepID=A0A4Q7W111_9BURK|nr:chorismate-binding protein [Rivibacter subsaxonicus]RZU02703.1 para-aminobenzoate synthetase/4-amino-4-deoxychorismate lyase [Rivibacter subsaxonicus]
MSDASVFALLDDCEASDSDPRSRLYTGFVREHRCTDPAALDDTWASAESDQRAGLHAVLLADYEWGTELLDAGRRERASGVGAPSLRLLMFRSLQRLSRAAVDDWLAARDEAGAVPGIAGTMDLRASVEQDEFNACIAAIHAAIRAGESYQVNYTYRLDGRAFGTPLALYRRLRARQPVRYGAFIALPARADTAGAPTHVLSCSPELFLRHQGGRLFAQPMKGTARRESWPIADSETARGLHEDAKNRAENLMIVDLLRNDLGRIARVGSVKVPTLFAVESHATVFQMTSSIEAEVAPGVTLPQLLRATFPCGSITGAPKLQTMKLIRQLESTPRGLYCGAIGWIDAAPTGATVGDFCCSVAIRTLTLGAEAADGTRPARLGIGAGIVLDSVAADEYEECRLKGRFLTGLDPGFALFETMRATRAGGVALRERHLRRLLASAKALGFAASRERVEAALDDAVGSLPAHGDWRLKLSLHHDGRIELQVAAEPLAAIDGPVHLRLAPLPRPVDALFAHKTTRREFYDAAIRVAEAAGCFDTLFHRADGTLVEGARSSIFLRLDGRWFTPPVADGALPGVMRGVLLDDPARAASEHRLTLADLRRAQQVVVCNALRGTLDAVVPAPAIA